MRKSEKKELTYTLIACVCCLLSLWLGILVGISGNGRVTFSGNLYLEGMQLCQASGGVLDYSISPADKGHWVKVTCLDTGVYEYHHHERYE